MVRSGLLVTISVALVAGCASLQLEGADFGWPVESVLSVGDDNRIQDDRYALAVPVGALAGAEFGDTTALRGSSLRVLRSSAGYYFITGPRFAHVYVFTGKDGVLAQHSTIRVVSEDASPPGLRNPALNQRPPHVQLLDEGGMRMLLTDDDIVAGGPNPGGAQ